MQRGNGAAGRLFPSSKSQWLFKQQFKQKNLNKTSSMSIFNLGNPGSTVCRYDFCSIPDFKQKSNWARKVWLQVKSEGLLDWISVCNYFFWGVAWSLQVKVIRWTVCSWMVLRMFSFQILAFFSLNVYVACELFYIFSIFLSLSSFLFLEHFE